jgi:hypothetical protein
MNAVAGTGERRANQAGRWPSILKATGIVLLLAALQAFGFHLYLDPGITAAGENLARLQLEAPTHRLLNGALETLHDYWRTTADEVRKRQAAALRETVVRLFKDDPRAAVGEFARVAAALEPRSEVERDILDTLRQRLRRLEIVYADHYGNALARYADVPWYLQPGAALHKAGRPAEQALRLNHALYLMLIGDRRGASEIHSELRQSPHSERFRSRVLFAQARLQYDAWRAEPDAQYYDDAVQYARQSVQSDPDYDLPKLFLEFLLSFDGQAVEIDSTPVEGQGSGEAQGERGAISTDPREF